MFFSLMKHRHLPKCPPDVMAHCARVKPILDLVHKIISTDWTVSDCLLPLTSRIYMLLQRYPYLYLSVCSFLANVLFLAAEIN